MRYTSKEIALGLDIGGTRIKTVALTVSGEVLEEFRLDSNAKHGPDAVRQAIASAVAHYREANIPFGRIGVGCAGSVTPGEGRVLNSPNFANWHNVPLRQWVEEDYKVSAVVANDANCAAVTEWKLGNGRGLKNMVLLTFGTGVGGGLILNDRLHVGSTGSAGELGHFSIYANGIACPCGNTGCFERYCSASALELKAPGHTAKEIFENEAREPFKQILTQFYQDIGVALTSIANVFDPDAILIGGGLAKGMASHLPELQKRVRAAAFPAVGKHLKILPTLHANQSGAMGAALLAFDQG